MTHSEADLRAIGCDPGRRAETYRATPAGSELLADSVGDGTVLVPGLTPTGYGSAESCISVARDGTIFFAPAFTPEGNGLLRSRDNGASWQLLIPRIPGGKSHPRIQPFLYLDPVTERLFFHTALMSVMPPSLASGFHLTTSDDKGESWSYQLVAEDTRDWAKIYGGPPVKSQTYNYPRALYLSASSPISTRFWPVLFPDHQSIHRSLDGGKTWKKVGRISLKPRDVPGCSRWEWIIYGSGVVASDGTVFLGGRRGPHLGIAISSDEGESWDVRDLPGSRLLAYFNILQVGLVNGNYVIGEPLAIDSDDNLYAIWPDHQDRLRLAVSRDGAATWSEPVVVSAPGVRRVYYGAATARAPGVIAIAYYGTEDGTATHGYIAESLNALDAGPVFRGAAVNPPAEPLYGKGFDPGYLDMVLRGGDLNEIVQVRYTPAGDIVASFCKHMRRGADTPGGWDYPSHANSRLQGVVGRMVHR